MKNLKAFKIGPDRYDIVVAESQEQAVQWYRDTANVPDDEWIDYEVNEHPMDEIMIFEDGPACTLREFVSDIKEFPCIACWVG